MKCSTSAESDPNRRFDRLPRLIANREWLAEAARIVLASSGARTPGIDGIDKQRLQVRLDQHLDDLRKSLLDESYRTAGEANLYPENQRQATPTGYSDAPRIMHLIQFALGMMDEDARNLPPIFADVDQQCYQSRWRIWFAVHR